MARLDLKQLAVAVLGVMLALGSVMSVAEAAGIATAMSVSVATGAASEIGGCGDEMAAETDACAAVCPGLSQGLVPVSNFINAAKIDSVRPQGDLALAGRSSDPDPYPPKPSILL